MNFKEATARPQTIPLPGKGRHFVSVPTIAWVSLLALLGMSLSLRAAEPPLPDRIQFNRDVRPILSDTCFHCHGPDKQARKGGFRLDDPSAARLPGDSGETPIIPGRPEASEIIRRVFAEDAAELMPPPQAHKPLTARQKEVLRRWVQQGAVYQRHWAFLPIVRPPVPPVRGTSGILHPVDAFIQARLQELGLPPAPRADRATLLRRLSLDLIGLPPTPAEIEQFLADRDPQAVGHAIDRLFRSPHYGERMAVDWLDAARFADTNGYQVDRDRSMSAYRDWVIRAFNQNMPFDQFTIEQFAGDLLPHPTQDQRIATGFHRNHMLNEEGGILEEEFLAEYTADRVETTATVWLGQTFNCARCHDHKFDPFTQRDFYSLKAFFHNVAEKGVGDYGKPSHLSSPPFLKLPTPAQARELAAAETQIRETEQAQAKLLEESKKHLAAWTKELAAHSPVWQHAEIESCGANFLGSAITSDRHTVALPALEPEQNVARLTLATRGQIPTAFRIRMVAGKGLLNWSGVRVTVSEPTAPAAARPAPASATAVPAARGNRGFQAVALRPLETAGGLSEAECRKLNDGIFRTHVRLASLEQALPQAVFALEEPEKIAPGSVATWQVSVEIETADQPARWQVEFTTEPVDRLVPQRILELARVGEKSWSPADTNQLAQFHASRQSAYRKLEQQLAQRNKQRETAETAIGTTLIMEELPHPRETFILMRGAYDKPGARVFAETPESLPAMRSPWPRNRLGLAHWLVSAENPLTARVAVNRLWQMLFGTGLVRTAEDFGSQGEPPSHPDLLDWLAAEYIASGWNTQALLRLMLTSETYGQSSRLTPQLGERDPENRWLARGPRFRLQAEFIRDQALFASGLLVAKIGGPSVKPYHPPGLYEQITAGTGTNVYVPGTGEDLYRRSMYTYWKRSVPNPAMLTFDAPFRETCTLRRPRTNTPLQALNLLNDPTYVEAARKLAERMLRSPGNSHAERITVGYRLLLARAPQPREVSLLAAAADRALRDFAADRPAAENLLKVGAIPADARLDPVQLAAWTTVASTLLNLDETITRD